MALSLADEIVAEFAYLNLKAGMPLLALQFFFVVQTNYEFVD